MQHESLETRRERLLALAEAHPVDTERPWGDAWAQEETKYYFELYMGTFEPGREIDREVLAHFDPELYARRTCRTSVENMQRWAQEACRLAGMDAGAPDAP